MVSRGQRRLGRGRAGAGRGLAGTATATVSRHAGAAVAAASVRLHLRLDLPDGTAPPPDLTDRSMPRTVSSLLLRACLLFAGGLYRSPPPRSDRARRLPTIPAPCSGAAADAGTRPCRTQGVRLELVPLATRTPRTSRCRAVPSMSSSTTGCGVACPRRGPALHLRRIRSHRRAVRAARQRHHQAPPISPAKARRRRRAVDKLAAAARLRAETLGVDLAQQVEPQYGAPPLLNQLALLASCRQC